MKKDTIIDIRNVSYSYNNQPALSNINLQIKRGEFLGIIGPNGSGKTTLLKIILGLIKPEKGTIELFGKKTEKFRDFQKIGYVPQKSASTVNQIPINVEEIVSMVTGLDDDVTEALLAVDMNKYRKKLLKELSGGQQQRVFIARALATNPELLILDEPTAGVDTESQARFYEMLRNLNKKFNLTLVLVSHDIDVVAHEVSEIACINCKLVCHGKPKEILKSNFMEKLYGKDLRFVVHGH